jgi:hypothetical membrane protein
MKKNNAIKIISLFGVFAVIFYFLHIIFGTILYEGYNSFAQAISDLTAESSPSKNIARAFSIIYGILSVIFSIGFLLYFKGKINKTVTVGLFVFCSMNIISFFGYSFFPLSEAGYAGTFQDIMHIIVTIFVVILTIISLIFYGIGFFRIRQYKYLGIISIIALFLLITGAMLINILPDKYFGLAQRINVYTTIIYTGILSLWMNQYINKQKTSA